MGSTFNLLVDCDCRNLGVGGIFCIQGKNDKLFSQGIILINVNF